MRKKPYQTAGTPWPHRLPTLCAAAVLLWCARGYCTGEAGTGLFWITALLAAAALALPRPLPGSSRWIIWLALAVTVVCMAANIGRLMPVKTDYARLYLLDRLVTALFAALGAGALFFRMGTAGVTRIMLGVLPMAMLVLARQTADAAAAARPPFLWTLIALAGLLELARQDAAHRASGAARFGMREWLARGGWMAAALAAALWLAPTVERAALDAQRRLMGMSLYSSHYRDWRRDPELPLFRALPVGFGRRTRLLLAIQAAEAPGYLRESVFTTYLQGRWLAPEAGTPLDPADARADPEEIFTRYLLLPDNPQRATERMLFDVFAPRLLTAICLLGAAATLFCPVDDDPRANSNGMVHVDNSTSARYEIDVWPSAAGAGAYQLPDGFSDPAYLLVPANLAQDVSEWVAGCPGLTEARTPTAAARCIRNHFTGRFAYSDTFRHPARPDPLIHFMKTHSGYCVHFASAAALMLRYRGIPARVVGGFVCREWAPWLRRWVVRERQGHAWVEAWDAAAGTWFLVEATPSAGLPAQHGRVGALRRTADLFLFLWRRLLVLVEETNPLQVVADAGAAAARGMRALLLSPWGGLLAAVCLLALAARHRRLRAAGTEALARQALARTAAALARRLVPGELQRRDWESWDGWLARIGGDLPPARREELSRWIEGYQELRYRNALDIDAARRWIAAARRAGRHGGASMTSGRITAP